MGERSVSILGSTGAVGWELAQQLLATGSLGRADRLQLVSRPDGPSGPKAYGIASDLFDAFGEQAPQIRVAMHPDEIEGDVIVMAAGVTLGPGWTSRDALAQANLPLFHRYARAIAERGRGHETVVVVSNSVELAVLVFSRYLGRQRVIGMGGHTDSLRFRRELSSELGLNRDQVQAFVVGEHSDLQVPLWSSVRIAGQSADASLEACRPFRPQRLITQLPQDLAQARTALRQVLDGGTVPDAYRFVDSLPADVRAILRPWVTFYAGASTPGGTARATADVVRALMSDEPRILSGQVMVEGEVCGLGAPLAVPVPVRRGGWTTIPPLELWPQEQEALVAATAALHVKLRSCQAGAGLPA